MKRWLYIGLLLTALLSGCALPAPSSAPVRYDFGVAPQVPLAVATGPALAVQVRAHAALDGPAMLYRLAYADERQLHAYGLARWVVPPAELVQQRLRDVLGQQRPVLEPGEAASNVLQIELEEFSQVFDAPAHSSGLLRLRATVLQATSGGYKVLAQRSVRVQRPAPSADAAGGARALQAAADAAAAELMQWVQTLPLSARP